MKYYRRLQTFIYQNLKKNIAELTLCIVENYQNIMCLFFADYLIILCRIEKNYILKKTFDIKSKNFLSLVHFLYN